MGFFDFESAEKDERSLQPVQGHGDSVEALLDHRWMSVAIIVFVIAVLAHLRELLMLVAFMQVIVLSAWLWSRASLRRLTYYRKWPYYRAFPDEQLEVQVIIENRKLLPVAWVWVEDEWPTALAPHNETAFARVEHDPETGYLINTYALRWYERVRRRIRITAVRRGVFEVGPVTLVSGDPFSLFDRKIGVDSWRDQLIVYPRIRSLPELGLPLKDPLGDRQVQQQLFEDPSRTIGIRDYMPQDSFRHIHWKATARAGHLQTRVYAPTRSQRTVLCLNVATFEQHWRGVWPAMLEYEMEVAASLASWGLEQGHSVGMTANGTLAHADQPFRILPSRHRDQLSRILEGLAAVSYFVTSSFDRFLIEESPRLPYGATLVLITPFVNDPILATMLRLRDNGRRLVLLNLGKLEPPALTGVLAYHLPIADDEPPLPPEPDEDAPEQTREISPLTARQRYLLRRAREESGRVEHTRSSPDD